MTRSQIQKQTDLTSRYRRTNSGIIAIPSFRQSDGIQLHSIGRTGLGASHIFGHAATRGIPPIDDFGPAVVFEAAFDGEQGVGGRFRPASSRLFEPVPDDALADAFTTPDTTCNPRAR